MKIGDKKGLSPVIATVLLVSLVLVLIAIIFMWARGFIAEQVEKGGKPAQEVCMDVSFEISNTYGYNKQSVEVQVVNRGNVPIYDFDVKIIGGGESKIQSYSINADVGGASEVTSIPITSDMEQIVFYPMVLGSVKGKKLNKAVTCLDNGKVITLQ